MLLQQCLEKKKRFLFFFSIIIRGATKCYFIIYFDQANKCKPHLFLDHAHDELVDLLAAVASISALVKVKELLLESAVGRGELEGPEKVGGFLEVGSDSEDFVNQVFAAENIVLAKNALNDLVVSNGNALLVDLAKSALVHERLHSLERGVSVRDVGLDEAKHVDRRLVELDENSVVNLAEAEKLEDLLHLGGDADDTANTDHDGDLGLSGNEDVAGRLGGASEADLLILSSLVLLDVSFGTLEDLLALRLARLLLRGVLLVAGGLELGESGPLLENGFGDAVNKKRENVSVKSNKIKANPIELQHVLSFASTCVR